MSEYERIVVHTHGHGQPPETSQYRSRCRPLIEIAFQDGSSETLRTLGEIAVATGHNRCPDPNTAGLLACVKCDDVDRL